MTEIVLHGFNQVRRFASESLFSVYTLLIIIPLGLFILDPGQFPHVSGLAAASFAGTLPYIIVAVLLVAYLKASGAETVLAKSFEGRETRMILLAALFGGLAPFCSCEVIPFISALLMVGVPLSAVMAFWLSSPLIDPPTVLITAAALGWDFAIGKTIAAVALGLIGGFGVRFLVHSGAFTAPLRDRKCGGCCGGGTSVFEGKPVWRFWKESGRVTTFSSEAQSNALFLMKWLALAYMLEGLLITYVPAEAIGAVVGGEGFFPIVIGALVGAPAYLNGYAAPALIDGLMQQGMSAGAAMAFMVAGAVSSVPAMAAVWSLVRRPVFFAYLGFGMGGAVFIGVVFAALV